MNWKEIINFSVISRYLTINNDRCKIRSNYLEGKNNTHKEAVLLIKKRIEELIEELKQYK